MFSILVSSFDPLIGNPKVEVSSFTNSRAISFRGLSFVSKGTSGKMNSSEWYCSSISPYESGTFVCIDPCTVSNYLAEGLGLLLAIPNLL